MSIQFERVAGPFKGITGGLAWDGKEMLFSAVQEERILRFNPASGAIDNFRRWTGRTNGIAMAGDGSVFGAQEGGRRIIQFMRDGSTAPTCPLIDGKYHNQPTDLVVDTKGCVWFTDPYHPVPPYGPPVFPFLEHASVLRLERDERRAWKLRRVTFDTTAPRALLLSADEKTLYVADGEPEKEGPKELRAYPIASDATVGPHAVLHAFGPGQRGIEGMCLDSTGNIVACCGRKRAGAEALISVFAPSGAVLESHVVPTEVPMRCAFGGADLADLYFTTGAGELYRGRIGRTGYQRTA